MLGDRKTNFYTDGLSENMAKVFLPPLSRELKSVSNQQLFLFEVLENFELFKNFTDVQLLDIIPLVDEIWIRKNDFLFKAGESANYLYMIVEGAIQLVAQPPFFDKEESITLYPYEYLAEYALLSNQSHAVSAIAAGSSRLLRIDKNTFKSFMETHPATAQCVMRNIQSEMVQESAQYLKLNQFTKQISKEISDPLSLAEHLQNAIDLFLSLVEADRSYLLDYKEQKVYGDYPLDYSSKILFGNEGLAYTSYQTQKIVSNACKTNHLSSIEQKLLQSYSHAIALPLNARYVLCLYRKDSYFNKHDVSFLNIAVKHMGMAIDNIQTQIHIHETVKLQTQDLEKANLLKSSFISNFSHELRNPLASIVGTLDYLLIYKKDEIGSFASLLERIEKSTKHVLEVLNAAVDYSKIEAGKLSIHRTWVDMNELVRSTQEIIMGYVEKFDKKSLQIEFAQASDMPVMYIDGTKIRQVLINLLSNAIKFTQEGSVRLTTQIDDRQIHFSIQDTGIGIKEEDKDKIFNAYEQVDNNGIQNKYGAGLGMSISKGIVEMHGGKIWFESKVNAGSTFYVSLPIKESE